MGMVSEDQMNYIDKLISERKQVLAERPDIRSMPCNDSFEASKLIDKLKTLPKDPDETMAPVVAAQPTRGINAYPGVCSSCNNVVEANDGHYYKVNGRSYQHHKVGMCPAKVILKDVTVGFWRGDSGEIIKVYKTQTGNLGCKRLDSKGSWVYSANTLMPLRKSVNLVQLTPEDVLPEVCIRKYGVPLGSDELRIKAAEYGAETSECMFCQKSLNDERSDPKLGGAGYGPDCAKRYKLPWGNVHIKK